MGMIPQRLAKRWAILCSAPVGSLSGTIAGSKLDPRHGAGHTARQSAYRSHTKKRSVGRESLLPGEGLWIAPCESVHTFFMRFPSILSTWTAS